MQLFFESKQAEVTKLLDSEGDLVKALDHKSGTWSLPVAVGVHHTLLPAKLLLVVNCCDRSSRLRNMHHC